MSTREECGPLNFVQFKHKNRESGHKLALPPDYWTCQKLNRVFTLFTLVSSQKITFQHWNGSPLTINPLRRSLSNQKRNFWKSRDVRRLKFQNAMQSILREKLLLIFAILQRVSHWKRNLSQIARSICIQKKGVFITSTAKATAPPEHSVFFKGRESRSQARKVRGGDGRRVGKCLWFRLDYKFG